MKTLLAYTFLTGVALVAPLRADDYLSELAGKYGTIQDAIRIGAEQYQDEQENIRLQREIELTKKQTEELKAKEAEAYLNDAKQWGKIIGERAYEFESSWDDVHEAESMQAHAVQAGAKTPNEIDEYVKICWAQMLETFHLLKSVQGHRNAGTVN